MRTLLAILLFTLSAIECISQTIIRGVITDVNNQPVPGANVLLRDTYDGTTSEADGTFSFSTQETGVGILIIRFIGYSEVNQSIQLNGESVDVKVMLREEINELAAVTINAGAFTASDQARRTIFKAVDIATTAGATADIAGALNTLPGTQKVGESGRLFVRGGDGSETRTFIDGMLVLDAYSPSAPNAPSRGRFLPFMFKGTSFSTGGYSAEFGQALSSALVLDSKDESEVTRTDIGILSVGGDVAHTHSWGKGSATGKIQYTNIRPYVGLINQEIDWKTPPSSLEGVAAFRQRVGKDGILKVYGNFSGSDFSLYRHDIDDYQQKTFYRLRNNYRYVNASYKFILNKDWSMRSGLSWSSIGNRSDVGEIGIDESERSLHAKTVVEGSLSKSVELKTGAELLYRNYTEIIARGASVAGFAEWLPSLFAEVDLYASNRFVTRVGARSELNSLTNEASVDPRLSLAYRLSHDGQLSFAYGRFRQTPLNKYVKASHSSQSEKATHYILNYQLVRNNRTFRVETFYKQYEDLVKFKDGEITNGGDGYAKGIELFWRDNETLKGVDYWVSYSLLDTKRNYLAFPYQSTPAFASRHNFSVVGKYYVRALKSQIGATYSFTSGRPYNDPNQEIFNGSKTPSYQDLSVNWSYLPKPHIIVYLSCTNLPGYNNVFGYEYSDTPGTSGVYNGRAIRQPAPRFLFLGIFITLSREKSFNQLPTL
jgi:hypothetical protein